MINKLIANILYKITNSGSYKAIANRALQQAIYQKFKKLGQYANLPKQLIIKNPQYISIGDGFSSLDNLRLEAWDAYGDQLFTPELYIGNNVCFNTDVHIACINKVSIGNNVLMASRIYISDHSHGEISKEALSKPPLYRPLVSKGPVVIEDNVWVGEGVSILPGVTIGKNTIIGTNAVVTKSFPENSVIAGNPARLIKTLN